LASGTKTILCAGGAVQDIVMRVETFPQAGTKVQASDVVTTTGGQSGNAAIALAHLGANVRYAGPLAQRTMRRRPMCARRWCGVCVCRGRHQMHAVRRHGRRADASGGGKLFEGAGLDGI
jgi:hypothetical protein